MQANLMDDRGSTALHQHLAQCPQLEMRQTRRGWLQECLGCDARTEFKYFIGKTQVFHSLEESDCLSRVCCAPCHEFTVAILEMHTGKEVMTVHRPFSLPLGPHKCCCYQEAFFSSGGQSLGRMEEQCWFCVPTYKVYNYNNDELYLVHPPTCCGGICIDPCADGNPVCGKGCCRQSFRLYSSHQGDTDGDAPCAGYILKKPKSLWTEIFTDANAFEVHFPAGAPADHKGMFLGATLLINENFFEETENAE